MTLPRRRLVLAEAALPLAACGPAPLQGFADFASARKVIESLATGWRSAGAFNLVQMLNRAAQSVEFSLRGFPEMKSVVFRLTVGYNRAHLMHLANHWTELVRA